MTRQHQLSVTKVDNGYKIDSRPDDRKGASLVAKTDKEVQEIVIDLVSHMFDPIPEKLPKPTA